MLKTPALLHIVQENEENKNHSWEIWAIFKHLVDEVEELDAALDGENTHECLQEIADVSNMCDILALAILELNGLAFEAPSSLLKV